MAEFDTHERMIIEAAAVRAAEAVVPLLRRIIENAFQNDAVLNHLERIATAQVSAAGAYKDTLSRELKVARERRREEEKTSRGDIEDEAGAGAGKD